MRRYGGCVALLVIALLVGVALVTVLLQASPIGFSGSAPSPEPPSSMPAPTDTPTPSSAPTEAPTETPTVALAGAGTQTAAALMVSATPELTDTPAVVAFAAVPLKIINTSGIEIGDGTIRVFAPDTVQRPQTARVELELRLDHQYITPTPFGVRTAFPVTQVTSTPSGTKPTTTPRIPIHERTGLTVYQRMGASLLCSPLSFDGCDTKASPQEAKIIRLSGATWSWIVSAKAETYGLQDLRVELWTVSQVNSAPEQADVIWDYPFQIEVRSANGLEALFTTLRQNIAIVLIALLAASAVIIAVFIGVGKRRSSKSTRARPTAFISYQRTGSWGVTLRIRDALQAKGADIFVDLHDINEGRFEDIIKQAIQKHDYFILVIAPDTFKSDWVIKETLYAIECGKKIIPVLTNGFDIQRDTVPDELAVIRSYNAVTLLPEYADAGINRLAEFMGLSLA